MSHNTKNGKCQTKSETIRYLKISIIRNRIIYLTLQTESF